VPSSVPYTTPLFLQYASHSPIHSVRAGMQKPRNQVGAEASPVELESPLVHAPYHHAHCV